jgi:hypothetical protein
MSFIGTVLNGVVVLPAHVHLNEGEQVQVIPAAASPEENWVLRDSAATTGVHTLPDDLAINHDFYLHGASKQQPRRGRWLPARASLREQTEAEAAEFSSQLQRFAAETNCSAVELHPCPAPPPVQGSGK